MPEFVSFHDFISLYLNNFCGNWAWLKSEKARRIRVWCIYWKFAFWIAFGLARLFLIKKQYPLVYVDFELSAILRSTLLLTFNRLCSLSKICRAALALDNCFENRDNNWTWLKSEKPQNKKKVLVIEEKFVMRIYNQAVMPT